jgi:NAD(P)-dependent dehydrogenase (short-subunit alcohol dehydrogenase family)
MDMRTQQEKIVLVTGSTDGIGLQTALELAKKGARVLVHGRDLRRCKQAEELIHGAVPQAKLESYVADLSSQKQILSLAEMIRSNHSHLDVLINNAGTYMNDRCLTVDGLEMTFAVNHMAPFLLTRLLLPLLEAADGARVVTVSSIAHMRASIDLDNLQGERYFDPYGAYALSKLGNVLFSFELARRVRDKNITSNCLHPGVITTKLLMKGFNSTGASVEEGAQTSVYLATSPKVGNVTGRYFVNCRVTEPSAQARDPELAREFWDVSEKLLRIYSCTRLNTTDQG